MEAGLIPPFITQSLRYKSLLSGSQTGPLSREYPIPRTLNYTSSRVPSNGTLLQVPQMELPHREEEREREILYV